MGPPAQKLCARRDDNRLIPRTSRSLATGAELPAEGILRPLGSSTLLPKVQPSFADGSAAPRLKGILPAQAPPDLHWEPKNKVTGCQDLSK
jgi:hypothetical protein